MTSAPSPASSATSSATSRRRTATADQQQVAHTVLGDQVPGDDAAQAAGATGDQHQFVGVPGDRAAAARAREPGGEDLVVADGQLRFVDRDRLVSRESASRSIRPNRPGFSDCAERTRPQTAAAATSGKSPSAAATALRSRRPGASRRSARRRAIPAATPRTCALTSCAASTASPLVSTWYRHPARYVHNGRKVARSRWRSARWWRAARPPSRDGTANRGRPPGQLLGGNSAQHQRFRPRRPVYRRVGRGDRHGVVAGPGEGAPAAWRRRSRAARRLPTRTAVRPRLRPMHERQACSAASSSAGCSPKPCRRRRHRAARPRRRHAVSPLPGGFSPWNNGP